MSLKILIADDHSVVLAGTKMIIETEFRNVKVEMVKSYTELLERFDKDHFDILLLDINMPGSKNLGMIPELKKVNGKTKIVIFSSYDEQVALRYLRAGADGFINKMSENDEIIYAINSIIDNGFYYSQKLTKLIVTQMNERDYEKDPKSLLSDREAEVFEMLLAGSGNLEISNRLELHMSTVSTYKKRILEKLNMPNTLEMIKNYYNFNQS